jgi:glycosyltransferase involved in cell wall biosynthesis
MDILKQRGHSVAGFARQHYLDKPSEYKRFFPPDIVTDRVGLSWEAFRTAKEIFYSRNARIGLKQLLSRFKPDIAHLHNIYGRLTTSVLSVLSSAQIPIVMTLHDYKLACPSYLFMRNNRSCEDCKEGRFYKAVLNRCHKGSYAASAIVALESYLNQWLDRYGKNVSFFISPSQFLKNKLVECGWPARKILHVANFLKLSEYVPNYAPGDYFLFLGRLSEEKGIDTLIEAYKQSHQNGLGLIIAGDGPMRDDLEKRAQDYPSIRFTGYLSGQKLLDITRKSLAVILPSICYENAPLSILEAMAYGKPVVGARIGGIPEMVQEGKTGFLFDPGDANDLSDVLDHVAQLPKMAIEAMGLTARNEIEDAYSTEVHYQQLMAIYKNLQGKQKI